MSWEQSIHDKPLAKLDAAALEQRQKVIDDYRNTLNDLEEQISKARFILRSIQQDTDDIHASRLKDYQALEENIKHQSYDLSLQSEQVKQAQVDLEAAHRELDERILTENQRVEVNTQTFLDHKSQLDAHSAEVDKQKVEQDQQAATLAALDIALSERKAELQALAHDLAQKESEIVVGRQELANDTLLHQQTIEDFHAQVEAFKIDQDRNMQFHDAIIAKEKTLEPLRDQYQAGIDANAKEIVRLRDENIRVYAVSKDAEKRLALAIEAEKKANSQIDKLESLKSDIHQSITEEK